MGYGFGAFFGLLPGGDISSLMLIYGFPISVSGGRGAVQCLPACLCFLPGCLPGATDCRL